ILQRDLASLQPLEHLRGFVLHLLCVGDVAVVDADRLGGLLSSWRGWLFLNRFWNFFHNRFSNRTFLVAS
ncbi:MAG: hypothetical protein ACK55Z_32510, partial [bacterium]